MKNKISKSPYLMVEMIAALGLLMILTTCFFASLKTLNNMDRTFSSEKRALMVADNTLERLANKKNYNSIDVKRIFMDEYQKSGLKNYSRITPKIEVQDNHTFLVLLKPNGKTFIKVPVKCQP